MRLQVVSLDLEVLGCVEYRHNNSDLNERPARPTDHGAAVPRLDYRDAGPKGILGNLASRALKAQAQQHFGPGVSARIPINVRRQSDPS